MGHFQYSSNPVADAAAYYAGADADQEDSARREDFYRGQFISDALLRPMAATNTVGEFTPDFSNPNATGQRPLRPCSIGEVLYQSLDWPTGPSVDNLIAYVVTQARAGESQALALLTEMAKAFARHKV